MNADCLLPNDWEHSNNSWNNAMVGDFFCSFALNSPENQKSYPGNNVHAHRVGDAARYTAQSVLQCFPSMVGNFPNQEFPTFVEINGVRSWEGWAFFNSLASSRFQEKGECFGQIWGWLRFFAVSGSLHAVSCTSLENCLVTSDFQVSPGWDCYFRSAPLRLFSERGQVIWLNETTPAWATETLALCFVFVTFCEDKRNEREKTSAHAAKATGHQWHQFNFLWVIWPGSVATELLW